ncbi:MAG: hypothetical protein IPN23_02955 [Elusimicrobia bacterium]|nr:hypothetical protein [Elusimicrobiota bacterium]
MTGALGAARALAAAACSVDAPVLLSGAVYALFALQTGLWLRRLGSFRWATALAYPVPAVFLFSSFSVRSSPSRWDGPWSGKGEPTNEGFLFPVPVTVAVDIAVWLAVQFAAAKFVTGLPAERLGADGWLYRARPLGTRGALATNFWA